MPSSDPPSRATPSHDPNASTDGRGGSARRILSEGAEVDPAPARRILLLHPGALGDLVLAFPAMAAVRAAFPAAHLTLVTDASLRALAEGTGLLDAVLGFDAAAAYRGSPLARLRTLARLVRLVRAARADLALVCKGAPIWAALARASGADRRVGLARGVGARLLTHAIRIEPDRHHADRYLEIARAAGADAPAPPVRWPAVPLPPDLLLLLTQRAGPRIGLAPGGARNAKQDMPTKRWPLDRWRDLAAELARRYPAATFVLLGAASDRAEVDAVRAALPAGSWCDLAGRTDLATARATIAALDVFVGHDSGLMHVAGTTDTPLVLPFGPTDPRVLAPRRAAVRALWAPSSPTPCYDEVTGAHRVCAVECCITSISVASVRDAVVEALADRSAV